jgi:hypothetical protein
VTATVPSTTTTTPTTTTTTTVAAERLADALPVPAELPEGWAPLGFGVLTDPQGASGSMVGLCAGDDGALRARSAGATAVVCSDEHGSADGRRFAVGLFAFPDEARAGDFLARTVAQAAACAAPIEVSVPEGEGEGQFDHLVGLGPGDGVVWSVSLVGEAAEDEVAEADEVVRVGWIRDARTSAEASSTTSRRASCRATSATAGWCSSATSGARSRRPGSPTRPSSSPTHPPRTT